MAMHGFQSSNSPEDTSGLPAAIAGHSLASTSEHALVGAAEHDRGMPQDKGGHDPEHHSGGEICLALLTLTAFASLLLAVWRAWSHGTLLPRMRGQRRLPLSSGRSPPEPSTFRSAVLRL
ncbi:hypothetical protein [Actinomadura sp. SCN-SB]|uniref:hypothetical protein n=1 Tax=Actinomadura sp. SCN-SB TaxID=3373092 RepID=UPI00375231F6